MGHGPQAGTTPLPHPCSDAFHSGGSRQPGSVRFSPSWQKVEIRTAGRTRPAAKWRVAYAMLRLKHRTASFANTFAATVCGCGCRRYAPQPANDKLSLVCSGVLLAGVRDAPHRIGCVVGHIERAVRARGYTGGTPPDRAICVDEAGHKVFVLSCRGAIGHAHTH